MHKRYFHFRLALFLFIAITLVRCNFVNQYNFETDTFTIGINKNGNIVQLTDKQSGINYLADEQLAPFLSIKVGGKVFNPSSMIFENSNEELILYYDSVNVTAHIKVLQKSFAHHI